MNKTLQVNQPLREEAAWCSFLKKYTYMAGCFSDTWLVKNHLYSMWEVLVPLGNVSVALSVLAAFLKVKARNSKRVPGVL